MGAITYAGKRQKRFRWGRFILIALVLYTVIGFFVVPAVIKSQMLKRLPALTHREAAVQQVKFNPYALSLTIRGFSLKETNGEVFSSFDEFYINFQPIASLFHRTWVFSEISLQKPFAQLTYREDGTFNFANLIPPAPATPPPPGPPAALPRVTIYSLSISNGAVAVADLKRKDPFRTQFIPIDLNLTNLTTIRDKDSPYSFLARTGDGETFGWSGTVTVNPLRSAGIFRIGAVPLAKYSTYAHDYARYEIAGGVLDIAAAYKYNSATNALDLEVSNLLVGLTGLELKSPDTGETNIAIQSFAISDTEASVARQTARVGLIKSSGGSLLVRRESDGSINLLDLLTLPPKPAGETNAANPPPSSEAKAWSVRIDDIAFDNYAFILQDKKLAHPATFDIDRLGFDIKGVSNASNAPVTASLSLRFAGTGTVAVNGSATLLPPSADLRLSLSNIDLRPLQPYVEEQARLAIAGGALDLHGHARYAPPEPGAPFVSFTGDLALNKFATVDDVLFKDFVKWDALNVDGIKIDLQSDLQPDLVHADRVKFTGLTSSLIIGPDRRPTLLTVMREKPAATNNAPTNLAIAAPPSKPPTLGFPVTLGAFELKTASIHYGDDSIEPHCSFDVQEFDGTVSNLSSDDQTTATVDFQGKVDERAPFSVSGKINPLASNLFADIAVTFTNTELTPLSTYAEKYVGRPLEKGKLSFAVHYLIDHNALKAGNGFFIDQFTLGPKNNSPDATHLPVKLAVDLLKDRSGRIALDVPVTGRLDDPKFKLGPVIWQVVENLLVKAATSPFSLLGAAFGGGDELSFVAFEPGRADVPDSETNKLQILARALYERPALTLEINGSADPARDRLPLAQFKLENQLKSLWIQEQRDAGKPVLSLDQVNLDPVLHERLVRKMYKAKFGRYQPTPVATNGVSGTGVVNPDAARVAALLATLAPEAPTLHGDTLLHESSPAAPKSLGKSSLSAPLSANPAPPPSRAQLELEDMQDQLVQTIVITNDDLRDLMQQRAKRVQDYLLETGKVTVDRLYITALKPVDDSFHGEDRVNLSLD